MDNSVFLSDGITANGPRIWRHWQRKLNDPDKYRETCVVNVGWKL